MLLCIGTNAFGQLGSASADDVCALLSLSGQPLGGTTTSSAVDGGVGIISNWGSPLYGEFDEGITASDSMIELGGNTSASVIGNVIHLRGIFTGELRFPERISQVAVGVRVMLFLDTTGRVYETIYNGDGGRKYRIVDELIAPISFVAAGKVSFAVVDIAHQAYTWGGNILGQCAQGEGAAQYLARATRIDTFDGLPTLSGRCSDVNEGVVASVAVSSCATAFLLQSGDIYLGPARALPLTTDSAAPPDAAVTLAQLGTALESVAPPRGSGGQSVGLVGGLPDDIEKIVAGQRHFALLTRSGQVWMWGAMCMPQPLAAGGGGPLPSIGPPCRGSLRPPYGSIIGSLGNAQGWGILSHASPIRLNFQELANLCGGATGNYRAVAIAAGGSSTIISLLRDKRTREED